MAQNPVRWFEIYVQDTARAKQFYEGVFQVTLQRLNAPGLEMWAFPMQRDQMGSAGAIVRMEGVPSGGNSVVVYFASADCATEEAQAEKLGGKIHKRKMSIGEYGYISLVYDPDGNMIGIHSMQ